MPTRPQRLRRPILLLILGLFALAVVGWGVTRATAGSRSLQVHRLTAVEALAGEDRAAATGTDRATAAEADRAAAADTGRADTIRVLAWNIAHNRGDRVQGSLQNFRGGPAEVRTARIARIAAVIREADADVVALNEADFDAAWSRGLDHAETLARTLGYPVWVEQRNYDYGVPFFGFAFGNALLTRLPLDSVRPVPIPSHSRLEAALIGAKTAAAAYLRTDAGPVVAVPVHLEFRPGDTRRAAVPALTSLLDDDGPPPILAGDFNTSPPGWPDTGTDTDTTTALGRLLDAGFTSPRATGPPAAEQLTFPSPDPRRAIDWVLAGPPLRVLHARVLRDHPELSDHLPVLAVVEVRAGG